MTSKRLVQLGILILVLLAVLAAPTAAAELALRLSNDLLGTGPRPDDLYTAETRLTVDLGAWRLRFDERMFTDRRREFRFDETSLLASAPVRFGLWYGEAGAGVLHVGRGLLGESVQNAVHQAIGSETVTLEYAVDHRFYPRGRMELRRPLWLGPWLDATLHVTADLVPGFDSEARLGVELEAALGSELTVLLGGGAVLHHVETDLLEGVIAEQGASWHVAFAWRQLLLGYGYNLYGTETGHLMLGIRIGRPEVHTLHRSLHPGTVRRPAVGAAGKVQDESNKSFTRHEKDRPAWHESWITSPGTRASRLSAAPRNTIERK